MYVGMHVCFKFFHQPHSRFDITPEKDLKFQILIVECIRFFTGTRQKFKKRIVYCVSNVNDASN